MNKLKIITLKEVKELKLRKLGEAWGASLGQCIYEGMLHCKDFDKKAKYYAINKAARFDDKNKKFITNARSIIIVGFYEDAEEMISELGDKTIKKEGSLN